MTVETDVPDNYAGIAKRGGKLVARCTPNRAAVRIDWVESTSRFGTKSEPAEAPQRSAKPQLVACPNCGSNLAIEPDTKGRVRCEYCRAMVALKS